MTAKIFAYPGVTAPVTEGPKPQADVIAVLEELLADARSGEVQAVSVALVHADGAPGDAWATGQSGFGHTLTAATTYLMHRLAASAIARGIFVTDKE